MKKKKITKTTAAKNMTVKTPKSENKVDADNSCRYELRKEILVSVFAFLIPVVMLLGVFLMEGIIPFGDKSLLIMDMNQQYVDFMCGLKNGDIWFSWSKTLGTSYIGVYAYYVASPFNFLTLFFSNEKMPYCVMLLTLLKIGLASVTARICMSRVVKLKAVESLLLAVAYGFCAYNIAYSFCIMWLDGVIWLPLIVLGIEKILQQKSGWLFGGSLFVTMISCFYIAYMIILFSIFYFVFRAIEEKIGFRRFIKSGLIFAISGILAAGCAAFFLVPTAISQFEGKLIAGGLDYESSQNFDFREILKSFVFGGYVSVTNSGMPFVFCGVYVFWLAIAFFARERISVLKKVLRLLFFAILLLSFWLAPLDKIWHIFRYPNWMPYRYAFLFSFLLILTAAESYAAVKPARIWWILILFVLNVADLFWNGHEILHGLDQEFYYTNMNDYEVSQSRKREILDGIIKDKEFCRVRSSNYRTLNDAIAWDYNGITHYSSAYIEALNTWFRSFGMAQSWLWNIDFGSTPVTDLFMDVAYVLTRESPGELYTEEARNDLTARYHYIYDGSIGYLTNADLAEWNDTWDPFENQNRLFSVMADSEDDVFTGVDEEFESNEFDARITFRSDGSPMYICFLNKGSNASLYVNDNYFSYLSSAEDSCIKYLGVFPKDEIVNLYIDDSVWDYRLRKLNVDTLQKGYDRLRENRLKNVKVQKNGKVYGEIECDKDGFLMTSIPYSKGWTARIDGRKTEVQKWMDAFTAVRVGAGKHRVELVYKAPGLAWGQILSVISLLIISAGFLLKRKKYMKKEV